MRLLIQFLVCIFFCEFSIVTCQFLDFKFGSVLKLTRLFMSDLIKPKSFNAGYQISLKNDKVQPFFHNDFFCDVNGAGSRSEKIPSSVNKLTPGDVDIIAAMGDSLTAANGAFAIDGLQTVLEGRGVSWSIGGKENWRRFLTLPNLIKAYNPKLYGYSEASSSLGFQRESKFNVAETGAISYHTIRQAKNLVKRMRTDPNVNINKHWKVITIMIGSNDFCLDICYYDNQEKLIDEAERNMIRVLRILRENLPRTLVNVVIPVDASILFSFKEISSECLGFQYLECPCLKSLTQAKKLKTTLKTIKLWKERLIKVVDSDEFHSRDDFEVSLIKFTKDMKLPETSGNITDYTYLSNDCFHLSQKGHSVFALNLWNQMMTAESERLNYPSFEYSHIKCPTLENPYLRTRKN